MAEKKKRRHLPPRGLPAEKPVIEKEDFGENTFAGAFAAVKDVIQQAERLTLSPPAKPSKAAKKK